MAKKNSKNDRRLARHARVRKDVFGTPERPRLCVYRSLKNISAQIIDDVNGKTLVAASSLEKELKAELHTNRPDGKGRCAGLLIEFSFGGV